MRIKTGGMQKGYKYSKKRFWINNGVIETLIFDYDDIPENFIKGRLKNSIAWNKGLTKDTDIRMKRLSEKLKKVKSEKPVLKYTDDFLKQNYIDNNLFMDYWENHGYMDCCKHFGLSDHVVKRIIKLAGLSSPREHSKKVKQLTYTEEWRQAHSDILKGKNTWSKGSKHSKEHIEKQKAAYKKRTDQQKINSKYKEHLSKIKNGTYKKHMTKEEIEVKNILEKYFNCADISYQYFDKERYPFECDFYVKSLDLFIEVNAYWTHGGRNYIAEDITCQQQLKGWEEKSKESKFYINAIYTWTDLDVRKYNYAVRNKLFYISLYNVSKLEEYLKIKMQNFSKITKIKKIVCDKTPVYDIGVPKYSNFILDNGLVVHNCVPYQYFKSTIYEKRLEMYDDRMLIHQIINLERNINTGKIDHPSGGAKDVCDAVCGSIFNASKHAEQFAYEYGESAEQLLQINENNSFSDDIKQLTLNMEEELKMINGRLKPDQIHPSDAQKKTEDYFMYDDIIIL